MTGYLSYLLVILIDELIHLSDASLIVHRQELDQILMANFTVNIVKKIHMTGSVTLTGVIVTSFVSRALTNVDFWFLILFHEHVLMLVALL